MSEVSKNLRSILMRWVRTCTELNLDFELSLQLYYKQTKKLLDRATGDGIAVDRELSSVLEEKQSFCGRLNPLYFSATNGRESCAKILLQRGWDVNEYTCCARNTALHVACATNDSRMVKLLLEHNANPNAMNQLEQTPLALAFENEASACIIVYREKHVNAFVYNLGYEYQGHNKMRQNYALWKRFSNDGDPLILASANCSFGALWCLQQYVIRNKQSYLINCVYHDSKRTPLMSIGQKCGNADMRLACLDMLLQCGADANVLSTDDECPALYYALLGDFDERYIDVLTKHTDPVLALRAMIRVGNLKVMKSLIEKNNDVVNGYGTRLVIEAFINLSETSVEMIKYLIEVAVDVAGDESVRIEWFASFLNGYNNRIFELAAKVMKMFLKAGFAEHGDLLHKVFFPTKEYEKIGNAILEMIWEYGSQEICNFLLSKVGSLKIEGRLPSLKHSCRTIVRCAVLSTGKYKTMFQVDENAFGIPTTLGKFILFSDE